ncbi:MAG TPA: tail fiber domain-containing protein [Candidatus Acidoferrum sp.]|nr:tail fiber domain-containing protein [Candidatus Acidoferrum sp.]
MKLRILFGMGACLGLSVVSTQTAPLGTAFTYQGRLTAGTEEANGPYDLKFGLYDAASGGNQVGVWITNTAVPISNGLFVATLDFGGSAFSGEACWLEVGVRTNGSSSDFTTLAPRQNLTPTPYAVYALSAGAAATAGELDVDNSSALRLEPGLPGEPNIIGGPNNAIFATYGSTIGGGSGNTVQVRSDSSFLGGGQGNTIGSYSEFAFLGGGLMNAILGDSLQFHYYSSLVGGSGNTIDHASYSFLGGGARNLIGTNADFSCLMGGSNNTNAGQYSMVPGGLLNFAEGDYSLAAGRRAKALHRGAFVWADPTDADFASSATNQFLIRASSGVGIGKTNPATALDVNGTVTATAFSGNSLGTPGVGPLEIDVNTTCALRLESGAYGHPNVIGGASDNSISTYGSTIGGGYMNTIQTNAGLSFLGGGYDNSIQSYAGSSFLGGGSYNTVQSYAASSFLGGGAENTIQDNASCSFLGCGNVNTIQSWCYNCFLGGGYQNTIEGDGGYAFLGGGYANTICPNAKLSCLVGGLNNTNGGMYTAVPGGLQNYAKGDYSLAAGRRAKALHSGAFVWADSTDADIASSATDQFTARANGGFSFYTQTWGNSNIGAVLGPGQTAWASLSDRNLKKNQTSVDGGEILEKLARIPVESWNYLWEKDSATPHLGPMAQEFKAAFYPGRDDKSITTLEFDGVELAAIQGLNQKLEAQRAENAELRREIADLKQLVIQLTVRLNGGAK